MENIRQFIDELDGSEHVVLTREDGSSLSMLKSAYDELQAQTNKIGVVTNGDN